MLRLADLQKKIDEAAEEMRHLTQDDQDRRPQHRELRQDNSYDDEIGRASCRERVSSPV